MTGVRDLEGRPAAIAAALGDTAPSGRVLDTMRRILDIGEHDDPAVADLLAAFQAEDEAAEEIRVGRKREARARTVETFEAFKAKRDAATAAPTGTRIVHFRDEATGQLNKLALPMEFFVD